MALVFEDQFGQEEFGFWWTVGAEAALEAGRARLACSTNYDGLLVSDPFSRLKASTWTVEAPVLADTSVNSTETFFQVQIDEDNALVIWITEGLLRFRELVAGSSSTTSLAYNAEQHRWWRIEVEADGTVKWQTSPDGETWTTRREKKSAISLEAEAHVRLRTGTWEAAELEPAYTEFDNLSVDVEWEDFSADWETGDYSQFVNLQAVEGRATVIDTPPIPQGEKAARFEVRQGDVEPETGNNRAEAISGRKYVEGETRYFRMLTRVDQTDNNFWILLWQLRISGSTNPPVCVTLDPNEGGRLQVAHGNGETIYWKGPIPPPGVWFELVIRVKFHPTEGEVQVWFNGVEQTMLISEGIATMGSVYSYDKIGVYRDEAAVETAIVLHDDYRVTEGFFSDPPILGVITGTATGITPTKATLNGTVDPNGLSTDYWFERWRDDWEAAGEPFRENECVEPLMGAGGANWLTFSGASKEVVETDLPQAMGGGTGNVLKVTTPEAASFAGVKLLADLSLPKAGTAAVVGAFIRAASGKKVRMAVQEKDGEGKENPQHQNNFEAGGGWEWQTVTPGIEPDTEKINLLLRANNDSAVVFEIVLVTLEFEREATLTDDEGFPRPHQLESGQAVWTGTEHESSSKLATPTYAPADKEGDAGEGSEAVAVDEAIEGLKPGTIYHFRLVAENDEGEAAGEDATFATLVAAATRVLSEPVDDTLFIELRHAGGSATRLGPDEYEAAGIPQAIDTADGAPGGHRTASFNLVRDPRRDWPDLHLVDDVVIYGRTRPLGRSAFEGQLAHFPSELGDGMSIGVNAVGHQVLLSEDESWRALYVALGFDGWGEAPFVRRERIAEDLGWPQGKISLASDSGGLVWDVPGGQALLDDETTEAHFQLPAGVKAARLGYRGTRRGSWASMEEAKLRKSDVEDHSTGTEEVSLTLDGTARTTSKFTPRRYLALRARVTSENTPGPGRQQAYDRLAVYGDNEIPLREIEDELPGVYAHDILPHMLDTGAPGLNYRVGANGTIVPNRFVLPDLAFPDTGKVADAIAKLNAYFLNNYAVWDRKEFHWHPWDPNRLTWRATIAGGAHWSPAGRQAETQLNGMVVSFDDHAGRPRLAGPPGSGCDFESELLLDTDRSNPYTRRGRRRWGVLRVDFPLAYGSTAVQIGHVKLLEQQIPQRSGTLVIRPLGEGHVPQLEHPTMGPMPIHVARSGDYVELDGWPEPEPFRIIEKPNYQHESKSMTLQLETASSRMSAIMERVGVSIKGVIGR